MLTYAFYFLQVVVCSGLMMGYYWLVLRNKRFHQYNRFYLLAVLGSAWLIPLIKIQWTKPVASESQALNLLSIVADNNAALEANITQAGYQFTWESAAMGLYILVALFILGTLLFGLFRVYRLLQQFPCKSVGDVFLILTHVKGAPFSFFQYIFWHESIDLKTDAGKQMLEHELTHVKEKHSVDKILIQLVLVVGWFNPFFWLLKKEMEMIHEFIADKKAVQNGDTASLAQMLLTAAYPQQYYAFTNPFFFSPIKRRLKMITNNKNPRFSYLRRLIVLPLLAVVVMLFAFRTKQIDNNKPISVGSLMETVADKIQGKAPVQDIALETMLPLEKTYTIVVDAGHGGDDKGAFSTDGKITEAAITLAFAKAVKEANHNPNIRIVLTRESDLFQSVQVKANFANEQKADLFVSLHANSADPVLHIQAPSTPNPAKGVEIYIANKEKAIDYPANAAFANSLGNAIKTVNPELIGIKSRSQGIWVLQAVKCPSAIIEAGFMTNAEDLKMMQDPNYQKRFANSLLTGVVNYLAAKEQQVTVAEFKAIKDTTVPKKTEGLNIPKSASGENPLVVVDGKIQTAEDWKNISPNNIATVDVLKGESAKALYGEAGKNGVIVIKTKTTEVTVTGADGKKMSFKADASLNGKIDSKVVYYVDGVKTDSLTMSKMDPQMIASVNVWKGDKALAKFGGDGQYGVIDIKTKTGSNKTMQEVEVIGYQTKTDSVRSAKSGVLFKSVESPAMFPGGISAWNKYLERNLSNDFLIKQNAPTGNYKVVVSFQVDIEGNVSQVHAVNNPGYGVNEEAEKLIKKGPKWKSAVQNGKIVASEVNQSITFTVPNQTK
jgi:TonB-dependent SusC/RagA subfamily outer membrane receptor